MGPLGLTEKPENVEEFACFQDQDIQIYLARDIFGQVNEHTEKLLVSVPDYGRFWLWFDDDKIRHKGERK